MRYTTPPAAQDPVRIVFDFQAVNGQSWLSRQASGETMNNHFAELGDVWKHLPLAEILRINPPRQYWETDVGSATYALTESPSRLHGALRFLSCAPCDPDLRDCAYLRALRSLSGVYPSSPALAL